jgi:glycosyltransferase involved in cell wall biosynthesis
VKILHIITSLKVGGAESSLYNFLSYISSHKNYSHKHVVVHFYDGMYAQKIRNLGIKVIHIRGLFLLYDPILLFRLMAIIRREQPNILHTALWIANVLGRLAGRFFKVPVVSDLHGLVRHEGKFRNYIEKITCRFSRYLVAVGPSVAHDYENVIFSKNRLKDKEQLVVINNGVDINFVIKQATVDPLIRQEVGLHNQAFVIGSVGRFETIKGYDLLITAFSKLLKKIPNKELKIRPIQLCLVGDGRQRYDLEKLVKNLKIQDNVIFTGMREDHHRFYPLFNCFALSSYSEGISISLLEALAFGLPVVTTNETMNHDVVEHGKHGFLVLGRDAEMYADSLKKFYADQTLCEKISINNKNQAKDYSLKNHVNSIYYLYDNLKI